MEFMKWEYTMRVLSLTKPEKFTNQDMISKELSPYLDDMGDAGWELASTVLIRNEVNGQNRNMDILCTFKRPVGWQYDE